MQMITWSERHQGRGVVKIELKQEVKIWGTDYVRNKGTGVKAVQRSAKGGEQEQEAMTIYGRSSEERPESAWIIIFMAEMINTLY